MLVRYVHDGMSYYRARYYDPTIGRFLGEDPAGYAGGTNFYQYVDNNPTNLTDPSGLCPSNVVSYIKNMCKYTNGLGEGCGRVLLIQSGFESTWGTYAPLVNDNNYLGMHGRGDKPPYSHPARKNKNASMPIFSSPGAGFTEYANRIKNRGITYQNDGQYISDITFQLGFAIPNDTKDPKVILQHQQHYIHAIEGMIDGCAQALTDCMKSRGH